MDSFISKLIMPTVIAVLCARDQNDTLHVLTSHSHHKVTAVLIVLINKIK